ncbi:MarR family winged helix-turn-helix transcriptional regulator [Massilia sp. GCM10020059]|uniref:MarR family winged helix-turn-helix transcriptional regulator n=1 Tax=Massilia agrisoli TaxID=2892444 RepID=A0ABS8IPN2_9BURK|nr:MarR family winged helix-turn-helix transcriptional regulator [Massilia agrisoli]MCC6070335.1 MarR family winged helix-turn-helix transcriptional regulator [Massilia agrisoli]
MPTTERLDSCNCFASRKAARLITKMYEDHLAPAGLTSSQFALLAHLDEAGSASIKELVEALAMERTSIVRALQPLERDALVDQAVDQNDARRHVISLSAAGRERLQQAIPLWQEAQAEFERIFGAGLAQQMRESIRGLSS